MHGATTRLLGRADIARTMRLPDYIDAVEQAFRLLAEGRVYVPEVVHMNAPGGGFHVKSAAYVGDPYYVAVKVNGNFPDNPRRAALPTIQGAIVLCDGRTGSLLAVIDSTEVTAMRTGATTAVAAKYLAAQDCSIATVIGCGIQGRVQLLALQAVLPLRSVYVFDLDPERSRTFAAQMRTESGLDVVPVENLRDATLASRVIVACTSSRRPFLGSEHVAPGTLVAAVGADNDDKQELHSGLMARAKVVVDLVDQCAAIGELHHALEAGVMTRAGVVAELAQIVAGTVQPEFEPDDIIVFDSTGSAFQDVAAAGVIYERALTADSGLSMAFA